MKRPVRSIGDSLRSQNFCPRVKKIRTVLDTPQYIFGHDSPVRSRSFMIIISMVHLKVTGKRMSLVSSQILPSPILVKEVTATKNPCSLDDFLVAECNTPIPQVRGRYGDIHT